MGQLEVGQVVVVNFPFSDLKGQKLRPALVLALAEFDNLILCQITSKPYSSRNAIMISKSDFSEGALPIESFARPDKLFTAEESLIKRPVGKLTESKILEIISSVKNLFSSN